MWHGNRHHHNSDAMDSGLYTRNSGSFCETYETTPLTLNFDYYEIVYHYRWDDR